MPYSKPTPPTGGHGVILYTEMEINLETLISLLGLLLGGGSIGSIISWRYARRKAKSEAQEAEAAAEKAKYESIQASIAATKEVQESYTKLIDDMKNDRVEQRSIIEEQKQYIQELKQDRVHLRQERDELRTRQDELEEMVRNLQRDVARYGRIVESMRPFLCTDTSCKKRQRGTISDQIDA